LRQTFTDVLGIEPSLVDAYRAELQEASPYERLLALHDDPLDVAAVLTGITLTPEISSRYQELLSHDPPTILLGNPPYFPRWGSRSLTRFEPFEQWQMPRRSVLVSMDEFARQMTKLGYRRARRQEAELISWQLRKNRNHLRRMPEFVTMQPPSQRTVTGQVAYQMNDILDFFAHIADLATKRGAPRETVLWIQRHRREFIQSFGR
jgi:hypothetical protein